jgi:hypothetical protein
LSDYVPDSLDDLRAAWRVFHLGDYHIPHEAAEVDAGFDAWLEDFEYMIATKARRSLREDV